MTTDATMIVTPFDGAFYEPDWRYNLAAVCAEDATFKPSAAEARQDRIVKDAIRYLRMKSSRSVKARSGRVRFDQVRPWGTHGLYRETGRVIEALLLTNAPMDAIAQDVGCGVEDLGLYERLFFNVRDDEGAMALSPLKKQFFASGGSYKPSRQRPEHLMWRRVAVSGGYRALVDILELGPGSWTDAPRVDLVEITTAMAKGETLAKVAAGGLSSGELIKLESVLLKDKLIRHQTGEKGVKDEGMELAIGILQMMAPKMVEQDKITQAQAAKAAENMAEAEEKIKETEFTDRGRLAGEQALEHELQRALAPLAKEHERQRDEKAAREAP